MKVTDTMRLFIGMFAGVLLFVIIVHPDITNIQVMGQLIIASAAASAGAFLVYKYTNPEISAPEVK